MHYIFYFLQLISPDSYSGMASAPSVSVYERSYEEMNSRAAQENREATCLSKIAYFEARGKSEGKKGMILVGAVTLNRVKSKGYGGSVCSVMRKKNAYSWYSDGLSDIPKDKERYKLARTVAKELLSGRYKSTLPSKVLYFKNCNTESAFFDKLRLYSRHSNHCFYYQKEERNS
jgi:spore germination cell wall hydrolase CwlJ-like protein